MTLRWILFAIVLAVLSVPARGDSLSTALDLYVNEQAEAGFSGTVLVTRGDAMVLHRTYGFDDADDEPAFWIGSVSKQFTAAAILKLAEQGRLSIHDRITGFFEQVPDRMRDIGVHHLLTHTSGIRQRYAADGITDRREAVHKILKAKPKQAVGEGYLYSNDGYNLLAAIIEVAADEPFDTYVQREIMKPAGMVASGLWGREGERHPTIAPPLDLKRANRIGRTIFLDGQSQPNYGYRGASGIFSTASDLHRWIRALRAGDVLSDESLGMMFTPHVISHMFEDMHYAYGYGVRVQVRKGQRVAVQHAGDDDWLGHSAVLVCTEDGDATIVLSNAGFQNGRAWSSVVARGINAILER